MRLSSVKSSSRIFLFSCIALSLCLGGNRAHAVDVENLPNAADEVLNTLSAGNNGLATYNNRTVGGVAQVDRLDATFTVSIDFDATPADSVGDLRELIWESGGGTIGYSICYEHPNTIALRASGNSGNSVATATVELSQDQLDGGELDLAWAWDTDDGAGNQVIAIIIDGAVAASATEDLQPDWSGGNAAAFGGASTSLAAGGGNTSLRARAFQSGTINVDIGLAFYVDTNWVPAGADDDGDGLDDGWELRFADDLATLGGKTAGGGEETAVFKNDDSYNGTHDTFLRNGNAFGGGMSNFGSCPTIESNEGTRIGLVRFDVSSLAGQFTGIESVTLRLFSQNAPATGGTAAYRLAPGNSAWREGGNCGGTVLGGNRHEATWVHLADYGGFPAAPASWVSGTPGPTSPGVDYVEAELGSEDNDVSAAGEEFDIELGGDLDALITGWASATTIEGCADRGGNPCWTADWNWAQPAPVSANEGILLRGFDGTTHSFHSSEADAALRPELIVTYISGAGGGQADFDSDGLSDVAEYAAGTDPTNADTDDDGLEDGAEVNDHGTSPTNADSDGDTLSDGAEVNDHGTSPTSGDTDEDGYADNAEILEGSDPLDAASIPAQSVATLGDSTESFHEAIVLPTWNNRAVGGFTQVDQIDATFTLSADFDAKTSGRREVLFETGGGWQGTSLCYETGSSVVLRVSGWGTNPDGVRENGWNVYEVRYALSAGLIDGGDVEVGIGLDSDNGNGGEDIRLIINGVIVGTVSNDADSTLSNGAGAFDWSGGNAGALGIAASGLAGTGERSDLFAVNFTSGTLNLDIGLQYWVNTNWLPEGADSDGDGLDDGYEAFYGGLDVLGAGDADEDGLSDADEAAAGTNPLNSDPDGDGLTDGAEVDAGTSNFNPDTDGDNLTDSEEIELGTDPTNADTDEDGINDNIEIAAGSDPTDPNSIPSDFVLDLDLVEPSEVINVLGVLPTYNARAVAGIPAVDLMNMTFTVVIDFDEKPEGQRELIW
ncbi:MAG: hypothetical protein MK554_12540, partial [Planctomycetes bacterium]|nr:hypothetical protein [Planctomycetota bacterium]